MTDDLVGRLRKLLADAEQQRREALNHLPGDTKFMMLTNSGHAERHVLAQVPLLFARIEALEAALKVIARKTSPTFGRGVMSGEEAASIARATLTPEAPHAD